MLFLGGLGTLRLGGDYDGGFSCGFICASWASLILPATALPAATCFGFLPAVLGVFEVTCPSAGCFCVSVASDIVCICEQKFLTEKLVCNAGQLFSIW